MMFDKPVHSFGNGETNIDEVLVNTVPVVTRERLNTAGRRQLPSIQTRPSSMTVDEYKRMSSKCKL